MHIKSSLHLIFHVLQHIQPEHEQWEEAELERCATVIAEVLLGWFWMRVISMVRAMTFAATGACTIGICLAIIAQLTCMRASTQSLGALY
jgi:hypothetical protein